MNGAPSFETVYQCPLCQSHPSLIFRCTECGEVRCSSTHCTGSEDSGYARWAADGTQCRCCHHGYYRRINFYSEEMRTFLSEHREKMERPLQDFFIDAA